MSIFASYFWLWSIVGLVGLVMLWTIGGLMNLIGLMSPLKGVSRWVDSAPTFVKAAMVAGLLGFLLYPALVHRLWADAKANETRGSFESLPSFPQARSGGTTEQMNGLYDPTSADGTYVIGWFGTGRAMEDVLGFYQSELTRRGWTQVAAEPATGGQAPRGLTGGSQAAQRTTRIEFRDSAQASRAHYSLVLSQVSANSASVPPQLARENTLYALRLGVVDPRATTQVAWFIDCLVHRAPTFPSCEAAGWNPIEGSLTGPG